MNAKLNHRQNTVTLKMVDAAGNALKNVPVHLNLKKHRFLFGCGAFDSVPLANGSLDAAGLTKMQDRFDKWLEIFNFGTLPFYLGRFEPEQGKPQTKELLAAAKLLQAHDITVKGHPLCWHTVCAPWLMEMSNKDILKTQLERITRDVSDFKGLIDMWDVINEVVIMPIFDKYDNAITRICKELGRVQMIKEVFKAARDASPNATLLLNDFNTSTNYEILIDGCLQAGVPIDVIGIQSHQHQGYWGKEKVLEVLERFSSFGLPIHFTENTLISGDLMPKHIVDLNDFKVDTWPSTPEGEERQAKEVKEMLTLLFENPLVEAFTIWDHADGKWLGAPSGVLRGDNGKKPVHEMLKQLIKKDWHTECDAVTNEQGEITFTGFMGDYEATAAQGSGRFVLADEANGVATVTL